MENKGSKGKDKKGGVGDHLGIKKNPSAMENDATNDLFKQMSQYSNKRRK